MTGHGSKATAGLPARRWRIGVAHLVTAGAVALTVLLSAAPASAQFVCGGAPAGAAPAGANAAGGDNTACGPNANASGTQTVFGGNVAVASGVFGNDASGNESGNVAIGSNAQSTGNTSSNVAIGENANARGSGMPLPGGATLTSNNVAVGRSATGAGDGGAAVAVGTFANAGARPNNINVAVGSFATALGAQSVAIGGEDRATSTRTTANATNSVAIGSAAQAGFFFADNAGATALGAGAQAGSTAAGQTNATAVGMGAQANARVASAFGAFAVASGDAATAIGQGAQATHANSVAIGAGSVTSAPNTVSVGSAGNERRITNVAAGVSPTDAVNVSQLSSVGAGFQGQINGLQSQVFANRSEARDGIAMALAAGGAPGLLPGRKFALSANIGTFEGGSAFAAGATALLADTKSYAVVANGSVGIGLNTNTIGGRGGVSLQW